MSINLDLDDVVYDQPLARKELAELRGERDRYKEALEKITSNKYAAFTCLKIAREALNAREDT